MCDVALTRISYVWLKPVRKDRALLAALAIGCLSRRAQFLLEALPGGRTRLVGRTWYRTNMVPEAYWRL